jgi:hypothetical protein
LLASRPMYNTCRSSPEANMSVTFLVLKWLSQVLIVTSGIYGMFSDLFKRDERTNTRRLTRAGWVNLATLFTGFLLFGVTDYKERLEQKVQEAQSKAQADGQQTIIKNQEGQIKSQGEELRYLHHLILVQESVDGWEISWVPPSKLISAARNKSAAMIFRDDAYLRTCLNISEINARKSSNEHWVITCTLSRPQGVLENLSFDLSPTQPEWGVFESILDTLLSSRFSISQSGGEDFVVLTRLERPDHISYSSRKVVVTVHGSHVKLSRLEQAVQVILRLDAEALSETPESVRIRSLDPNLKLDETLRTKWNKRQVGTRPNYAGALSGDPVTQEPVFAFFSGPHEITGSFNKMLFSFAKEENMGRK